MTLGKPSGSRGAAHFDRLYARSDDPWNFRASAYERSKYVATIAAMPPRRFAAGLEIGCSIGELTRMLAPRCASLLGIDIAPAALRTARARNADLAHVRFRRMAVPAEWPGNGFDLIVLSEVLYFLAPDDIRAVARRVTASLEPGGVVLLVNFLGATDDPVSGEAAAETFLAAGAARWRLDLHCRCDRFRIDRLVGAEPG